MTLPRPRAFGLLGKLALFFALLSLPALLLVEISVVLVEYTRLIARIDSGLLRGAMEIEAQHMAKYVARERVTVLDHALAAWLLRLERPRSLLGDETAYVLLELARQPFSAAIVDRDGRLLAQAPDEESQWQMDVAAAVRELEAELPSQELSRTTAGAEFVRRYAAPMWRDRKLHGWLILEIRLNKPWRKMASDLSFEWPVILATLVLIALGAAFFLRWTVTRRLDRIGQAARSWSRGDFSETIADRSEDELGILSRELDRMALALRELFHTRSALARMSERERLARDLHDTVKQQTFAVHLKIATILKRVRNPEDPLHAELERVRLLVHSIQSELTQILTGLRNDNDSPLPLVERLRAQLDAWGQISGIAARLRAQADIDLPPAQQDELLKLVDEALANVLKHSEAKHVDVLLQKRSGRALLRLSDDGRGVARDLADAGGMGLDNMRSRAAQLPGGQWRILPGPAGGTVVEVGWILKETVDVA